MSAPIPDHAALPVEQLRVTPPRPVWIGGPEEFWTCDDGAERLSCTEFEEALIEGVDGYLAPGCDTEKVLREEVAPLEVYGYSRSVVEDRRLATEAASLVEHLRESFNEDEWGDPDGVHDVLSDEGAKLLTERFAAALREVRHHILPWHCEVTKRVVLDADELVSLVRELEPGWFEPKGDTSTTLTPDAASRAAEVTCCAKCGDPCAEDGHPSHGGKTKKRTVL